MVSFQNISYSSLIFESLQTEKVWKPVVWSVLGLLINVCIFLKRKNVIEACVYASLVQSMFSTFKIILSKIVVLFSLVCAYMYVRFIWQFCSKASHSNIVNVLGVVQLGIIVGVVMGLASSDVEKFI